MAEIRNNISLKATPTEPEHVTNVEYVDGRSVEISWADYLALSEEEKNNGTEYWIPDMPVGINAKAIEEPEHLNGYLNVSTINSGDIIPFVADSNSNMKITDGLVTLKKGKTYSIFCDIRFEYKTGSTGPYCRYGIKNDNGKVLGKYGFDAPATRTLDGKGIHTSVGYTISPTEDTTIGIYVLVCESVVSTNADYNKLIITEIPSYKGLLDVTDQHIKEVASEDLDNKIDKSSIAESLTSSSTNEQVAGAKDVYSIKTTADSALKKINNHLANTYKIEGVNFNRGAISPGNYIIIEIPYTVPSGYYIINFQVAHNGHYGIYIFTQYLSGINGDMKFIIGFANATQSDIEAQTDLILNVYLAKV